MKSHFSIRFLNVSVVVGLFVLAAWPQRASGQLTFVRGHYYTANYSSRTIMQYDASGAVVRSFTVPTNLADEVRGLAFSSDGLLYACAVRGSGFNVLAYDAAGQLRQTYTGNVYVRGNVSYGKLAVDDEYIYVAGQNQLIRFDIGNPAPGVAIYQNNQVYDVEVMPNGHLLVLSAYRVDEITPDGAVVRNFPSRFIDARGIEYDPVNDKLFVTQLGYSGFSFQLMRFDWPTAVMETNTYFWYGDDIFLTDSGNLLVGSRTMPPTFFTPDLMQVGTLGGGQQMFVTQLLFEPPSTNAPPTVACPEATLVECGTQAELTAHVSDPEGDALTVVWTLNGTAIQTNLVAASHPGTVSGVSLSGSFPLGTNIVAIDVCDGTNVTSCTSSITVVDTTPPVISEVTAFPNVLWPPDRRMVMVTVSATVSDNCGEASWRIIGVQCSGCLDAGGGNTGADWIIAGDDTVFLRADRAGRKGSRIYFIQVQATDASGNHSAVRTVTVTVRAR